ncbi:glycosyltransferase family 4 protein [bacterium]|nr:glycosyltransferase family 4 protein [bacterium]
MASRVKKITVLYIDQALAFGGSLVVAGYAINSIDKEKFRSVFVGELDLETMRHFIGLDIPIYKVSKIINYARWAKINSKIRLIRSDRFKKYITYLLSMFCSLLNTIYFIRVALIILKEGVDIVHVNNGLSNIEPILASIILRRVCVAHYHGDEKPSLFQRMVMNKVQKFIVISEYLKGELVANGIPSKDMVVIHNPSQKKHIDVDDVEAMRKKFCVMPDDKVFGIVGRVVRWKGHIEFLNAAKIVLRDEPTSKALIIGDYSDGDLAYQEEVTRIIEESGFKDRIIFTGFVNNVQSFYQLMDVCVHTSIEPEPFGLVITEAMSYGVPVVASDRGAPKEIIEDGLNGFIIDPEDTGKLVETITRLLSDASLRDEIANKGSEHVKEAYNLSKFGDSLNRIYLKAVSNDKA